MSRFPPQLKDRVYQGVSATWEDDFSFIVLGDPQFGMMTANQSWEEDEKILRKAVPYINAQKPKFVVVAGDLTHAEPGVEQHDAETGALRSCLDEISPDIPVLCLPGNHDICNVPTAQSIKAYTDVWGDDYYAASIGGVNCLVLNSVLFARPELSEEVEQLRQQQMEWMSKQLASWKENPAKHLFVFQHHPLYFEDPSDADREFSPDSPILVPKVRREGLIQAYKEAGVTGVFVGHYHRNVSAPTQGAGFHMVTTTGAATGQLGKDLPGFRVVKVTKDSISEEYHNWEDVL